MAYDPHLARRLRDALGDRPGLTEKAMFGGVAFLRDGRMFAGVNGADVMARVGKPHHDTWASHPAARPMDFTGRPMAGYLYVRPDGLTDADLTRWLDHCWAFVGTLEAPRPR